MCSKGHTDELWGLDVHPSMEQFVTCAQDKLVQLWDSNSHQPLWSKSIEVRRWKGCDLKKQKPRNPEAFMSGFCSAFQDQARSVGFHPSGAVLAVGTMTGRSEDGFHEHKTNFNKVYQLLVFTVVEHK